MVDGFAWPEHLAPETWTGFRRATQPGQRPVEQVSLRELGNAMVGLRAAGGGISRDELFRETHAVFGGLRVTAVIAASLDAAL